MAAGNGALHISFFTALAIALLLSMVAFSYRQTDMLILMAGVYNVSRQNLGQTAGLVAAAALLIDYVMTVLCQSLPGPRLLPRAYCYRFSSQILINRRFTPFLT